MYEDLQTDEAGRVILPRPSDIPRKERQDAMGAYLMMFASAGIGLPIPVVGILAAVIYYFVNRHRSRFVAFHSYQSMLTQLPISIINSVLVVWVVRQIFILDSTDFSAIFWYFLAFAALWNIVYLAISIIAAVQANNGRFYYMLGFGRLAFKRFYTPGRGREFESDRNLPPGD